VTRKRSAENLAGPHRSHEVASSDHELLPVFRFGTDGPPESGVVTVLGVAGPELGAQERRVGGAGLKRRDRVLDRAQAGVTVEGEAGVRPVDALGGQVAGPRDRRVGTVEGHEAAQEDEGARSHRADRVVDRHLLVPVRLRPVVGGVGHRLVVRLVDHVGLAGVSSAVEIPEVEGLLQAVDEAVLAVAADGDDEIQAGLGGTLHEGVRHVDVHADGIRVLRRVPFQVDVGGVRRMSRRGRRGWRGPGRTASACLDRSREEFSSCAEFSSSDTIMLSVRSSRHLACCTGW